MAALDVAEMTRIQVTHAGGGIIRPAARLA
jgi:hypothetical protein